MAPGNPPSPRDAARNRILALLFALGIVFVCSWFLVSTLLLAGGAVRVHSPTGPRAPAPLCMPAETCSDTLDNDCDGLADCADPECTENPACAPATAVCGNGTLETGETCDDGNTQDGDSCSADCQRATTNPCFPVNEICADNVDNDCDAVFDCADSDCFNSFSCASCGDNYCAGNETCASCSHDCGVCTPPTPPTPPGGFIYPPWAPYLPEAALPVEPLPPTESPASSTNPPTSGTIPTNGPPSPELETLEPASDALPLPAQPSTPGFLPFVLGTGLFLIFLAGFLHFGRELVHLPGKLI